MTLAPISIAFAVTFAAALLKPLRASAHCDTMGGPTAQDGLPKHQAVVSRLVASAPRTSTTGLIGSDGGLEARR